MADRAMTAAAAPLQSMTPSGAFDGRTLHPVMAYIAAIWPNFASGKTPKQKIAMIGAWEAALADVPVKLQKAAIDAKAKAGAMWPPSSPAELLTWCDAIQRPMDGLDVMFYRQRADDGILDRDFCLRQIAKYQAAQAAGRRAYAGMD